jgi:hypothetical protein
MHNPVPQRERNGRRGAFFFYVQGHENIKMASGCIVERPPSSLPSGGKKLFGSVIPSFKKRTLENKNNLGGGGRFVYEAWHVH